ncbi:hypothetical protein BGX38DRAFT_525339 [Terfezia claveryi]|nr:hypothetical protein BGX38DRAFT_525339 [Terfezia claveryi]
MKKQRGVRAEGNSSQDVKITIILLSLIIVLRTHASPGQSEQWILSTPPVGCSSPLPLLSGTSTSCKNPALAVRYSCYCSSKGSAGTARSRAVRWRGGHGLVGPGRQCDTEVNKGIVPGWRVGEEQDIGLYERFGSGHQEGFSL